MRMSYLPECAREMECARCHEILDVKVTESLVNAIIPKVSYVPNSNYQFVIEFDFISAFVTTAFTYVVQINKDFSDNCFSEDDLNQQIEWFVDPAKLAQNEETGELSLEDLEVIDNIDAINN